MLLFSPPSSTTLVNNSFSLLLHTLVRIYFSKGAVIQLGLLSAKTVSSNNFETLKKKKSEFYFLEIVLLFVSLYMFNGNNLKILTI